MVGVVHAGNVFQHIVSNITGESNKSGVLVVHQFDLHTGKKVGKQILMVVGQFEIYLWLF